MYNNNYQWYHEFYLSGDELPYKFVTTNDNTSINFNGFWDHNPATKTIIPLLQEIRGETIIDVGCMDGFYSCIFDEIGAITTMTDLNDRASRREIFRLLGKEDNFIHSNLYQLDKIGIKFSYVWCQDVFCHLDNPILALRVLREICNKRIFLGLDRVKIDFNIESYVENDSSSGVGYRDNEYTFTFDEKTIEKIFVNCGFCKPEIFCSSEIIGMKNFNGINRIVDIYSAEINPHYVMLWKPLDWITREPDELLF